jgi:hypothetical protein
MAPPLVEWDPGGVFERFTDRARRVLVLAQEEAGLLNHSFIGTEHILLGLIHESDGVAAKVIAEFGISLEDVRVQVEQIVGPGATVPSGSPPFTPRAKKVLELGLREALQLGHNYIGTEHLLLGLVREGEGVAVQILVSLGADPVAVRLALVQFVQGAQGPVGPFTTTRPLGRRGSLVECSFCGRRPPESGRLLSGRGRVYVCEHCVDQFSATLAAPTEAVSEGAVPRVVTGATPVNEVEARMEIALAFGHAVVLSEDRRTVPSVEGGDLLGPCLKEAQERHASLRHPDGTITIFDIEFLDEEHASVTFTMALEGITLEPQRGEALLIDTTWKMARATFCQLMSRAGVQCPPENP